MAEGGVSDVFAWRPEAHEAANNVESLLYQQGGRNAGVDTAGHGDEDAISWTRVHGGGDDRSRGGQAWYPDRSVRRTSP